MSDANKQLVKKFFDEMCNKGQLGLADQFFAASHVYHDPAIPSVRPGPAGMQDVIGVYQRSFAPAHWDVHATLAEGDTVVTRWSGRGTHSAEFAGLAPTGKTVSVDGLWMHRIA